MEEERKGHKMTPAGVPISPRRGLRAEEVRLQVRDSQEEGRGRGDVHLRQIRGAADCRSQRNTEMPPWRALQARGKLLRKNWILEFGVRFTKDLYTPLLAQCGVGVGGEWNGGMGVGLDEQLSSEPKLQGESWCLWVCASAASLLLCFPCSG